MIDRDPDEMAMMAMMAIDNGRDHEDGNGLIIIDDCDYINDKKFWLPSSLYSNSVSPIHELLNGEVSVVAGASPRPTLVISAGYQTFIFTASLYVL